MTRRAPLLPVLAPILLAAAAPALAVTPLRPWTSQDGTAFHAEPAPEGALLRSATPVTYHVGAAGRPVTGPETVLLRRDCSALSALGGEGFWGRDAHGFHAAFVEGSGLWFDGQEPPAALAGLCG